MTLHRLPEERSWYDDRRRLAALADWLTEQGREPDDWRRFFEKPWAWESSYTEMCHEEDQDRFVDEAEAAEDEEWRDMQRRSAL